MHMGALHRFGDRKTGATDLEVKAILTNRQCMFKYVLYNRSGPGTIDLELALCVPGWGEYTIREQLGFAGTYWVFREPFELPPNGYAVLKTTGAAAGEDHRAVIVLEEMDQ